MSADKKNILVVDDEKKILCAVSAFLQSKGYAVLTAENGRAAIETVERMNVALVLLDLMLPDIPGEQVCRVIRRKSRVPIIMLTAKTQESDMISGLGMGADDYITKPFSLKELLARIESVLRRSADDLVPLTEKNSWRGGDLTVDFGSGIVKKKGHDVSLTPSERKLLAAFIKYPGSVFTREELIGLVFGEGAESYDRVIDTHIKNLRQKIEDDPRSPVYVLTVFGAGYRFGGD